MFRARGMLVGLGVAGALLAGCVATQHPLMREASDIGAQAVCCANYRDMPFVALPAAQKRRFTIDVETPVYAFRDGRSRFVALKLPPSTANLRVRSNVVTIWVEPTTFDPFVTFLDRNFQSLGEANPAMRMAGEGAARYAEAVVLVPAAAAYAVVYTKPVLYLTRRPEGPLLLTSGRQSMSLPVNAFPVVAGPRGELVLEAATRSN